MSCSEETTPLIQNESNVPSDEVLEQDWWILKNWKLVVTIILILWTLIGISVFFAIFTGPVLPPPPEDRELR